MPSGDRLQREAIRNPFHAATDAPIVRCDGSDGNTLPWLIAAGAMRCFPGTSLIGPG
jgi:hypothetical protein